MKARQSENPPKGYKADIDTCKRNNDSSGSRQTSVTALVTSGVALTKKTLFDQVCSSLVFNIFKEVIRFSENRYEVRR